MKPVATNAFVVERARQGEEFGLDRLRAMKGRVEAGHLRQTRMDAHEAAYRRKIVRLMQRRQGDQASQCCQNRLINPHRQAEFRPPMHHPMPNRHQASRGQRPLEPGPQKAERVAGVAIGIVIQIKRLGG